MIHYTKNLVSFLFFLKLLFLIIYFIHFISRSWFPCPPSPDTNPLWHIKSLQHPVYPLRLRLDKAAQLGEQDPQAENRLRGSATPPQLLGDPHEDQAAHMWHVYVCEEPRSSPHMLFCCWFSLWEFPNDPVCWLCWSFCRVPVHSGTLNPSPQLFHTTPWIPSVWFWVCASVLVSY